MKTIATPQTTANTTAIAAPPQLPQAPICMALRVFVMASDGLGWKHVSVSFGPNKATPSWGVMCFVKDLFWEPEEVVMQLHVARSEWISNHPGCLHLWQPLGVEIPTPPGVMVGIKELGELK